MAHTGATPTTELLDLSDPATDSEDLFASPSRSIKEQRSSQQTRPEPGSLSTADTSSREPRHDADLDSEQAHEAALRRELAGIRSINEVLEEVVNSLEQARGNMDAVSRTVTNASNLLHTWTRILSQTEHNQRLILNPSWQGASQDISALETETIRRRQEQERKEMEEQSREARARKAEDDERKREEAVSGRGSRGARGRGRGTGRVSSGGHVGVGGQGGRGSSRGVGTIPGRASSGISGIGRGLSGRGRERGRG